MGYCYDYCHVGAALADRVGGCAYLHETRELGLTDHAEVRLELALDAVRLSYGDAVEPDEIALF
ncbi:hypothetical protein [Streptosporangium sp. NPDC051022]|uniref:hypothetical protein n=1 Tax=Streptosporangium sp. NPDC051022 TaxID=3155752 RepID=UPI0034475897